MLPSSPRPHPPTKSMSRKKVTSVSGPASSGARVSWRGSLNEPDLFTRLSHPCKLSRQQLRHDSAVDIGQPVVAALETVDELGVVEAEQVQYGGLQVVDMYLITGDREAKFVGRAVRVAALRAAAGQP